MFFIDTNTAHKEIGSHIQVNSRKKFFSYLFNVNILNFEIKVLYFVN